MRQKTGPFQWIANILIMLTTLFFLWPFYWMLIGSFKNLKVGMEIPPQWFPKAPSFDNYRHILTKYPLGIWFGNSLIISVSATFLVLVCCSLAGYALSKIEFKSRKVLFVIIVSAMSLPHTVLLIPLYQIISDMRMINTYWALILPAVAWPFGVFLIRQFMVMLPSALIESGRIDGASEFGIFYRIILPLAMPGLAVLAIFFFVGSWNDYVWQLIVLTDKNMFTLPLGVKIAQTTIDASTKNYGAGMAGAVIATLPVLAVFIFFQKYFMSGLTVGAMKG